MSVFLEGGFQTDLLFVLQLFAVAGSIVWGAAKLKTETALIRQTLANHGKRFEHICVENSEAFRKVCESLEKFSEKVDRHHDDLILLKERTKSRPCPASDKKNRRDEDGD